ncbi:hypothetical protein GCM10020358_39350 [Amorphoplanes nipponensis]|uniref:DUF4333 domain-containing protein n=1 Tax=Actinoplanes nipponensis TaxID=135950 RepID=A0A919JKW7_9ACTN|nr:hypothetical protein [Actinoplanes nipponensis]GIE51027.1 hypothetical protein Ani05nite_45610 [Actinoplanes nipponensis]
MTTQVPPGPENAVSPQDPHPQFAMGYAQYPPVHHEPAPYRPAAFAPAQRDAHHHAAHHDAAQRDAAQRDAAQRDAAQQPISAPPAAYPTGGYPGGYPPVSYPQQGAPGYPEPVPYPQPGAAAPAPGAYPTTPPWATPAPPAAGPAPAPGRPALPHGGLLVPYPDEMQHASRAQAPAVWPVAVFTLLFGILGAVSAKRRAAQARRGRNSAAPYWIAFLASAVAGAFCWFVVAAVLVGPVLTGIQENQRLEAVQRNVVGDGQLRDAHITATAAQCRAVTERNPDGMRDYMCRLTLADGHTATLALTADESGQWHSGPGR